MAKREAQINTGIKLFRDFNDEEPRYLDEIEFPDLSAQTLVLIGPCLAIEYHARDGHDYRHKFKRAARPELAVTENGLQLVLFGGNYRFTDRGITDR